MAKITTREREAVLNSLGAGVVPSIGLQHIQVGRLNEVSAIVKDLENISQGVATVRFVVGRYGSGKTFFLNLARNVAMQKRFVVLEANITTDRRLQGTGGKARALYTEMLCNLATRAKPEGKALPNLVERWVGELDQRVRAAGGSADEVKAEFGKELRPLQELVSGYDFVAVLTKYYEGYLSGDYSLQDAALRWIRAEFSTKMQAKEELGVRTIINDDSWYDFVKLFAQFTSIAGYAGILVCIDELVVLSHRLSNAAARNNNYEAILRILNDCLSGHASGIGFLFAGTPECLEDPRRGIFSYEALATRLAPNHFATAGVKDFSSPVIRLENLTPEDNFLLLSNIRNVHALGDPSKYLVPDEGIVKCLELCQARLGATYFQTPRNTSKTFVGLLRVLEQNPQKPWNELLTGDMVSTTADVDPNATPVADVPDELAEFKL